MVTRNPDQIQSDDMSAKPWEATLYRLLSVTLVSSIIFAGEKLIVQILVVNFHKVQFKERIAIDEWVFKMLAELNYHSRQKFTPFCREVLEEDCVLMGALPNKLQKASHLNQFKKVMGNVGVDVQDTLRRVTRGITGESISSSDVLNDTVEALNTIMSSASLAKRIWKSFVPHGKQLLCVEDFRAVMGSENSIDAAEAFDYLDRDGHGNISLDDMKTAVVDISKERKAVARSVRDAKLAIQRLDELLLVIVLIIVVFVFVAFFNKSFTTTLATAGTALFSLSFIFAATLQEVMASCVFLFIKHPFDIGDRVEFQNERYTVKEMALLYTIFERMDGRAVQSSNTFLNNLLIENIDRSQSMAENVRVLIAFKTTMDEIEKLRGMLQIFLDRHPRDFQHQVTISVSKIIALSQIELCIMVQHKSNWSNELISAQRRNMFMCALVEALQAVIKGRVENDESL